jgi:NTP pyrophosphatase (non-canonical NTP hydrolase)
VNCPKHPQCRVWDSATGPRCSVCGDMLDGRPPPEPEPLIIRTFETYRRLITSDDHKFPLEYHAACVCEEAGELYGKVKKVVYHGHPLDDAMRAKMIEEAGDVLWYLDRAMDRIGVKLEDVAARNIEKLRRRYPDGFTKEASRNRKDG